MPRVITTSDDGRFATVLTEMAMTAPWYQYFEVPVVVDLRAARLVGPVVHDLDIERAVLSPDGQRLVIGGVDGSVRIRRAAAEKASVLASGGQAPVLSLGWSPDGRTVFVGRGDGRVDVLDVATASVESILTGHGVGVTAVREVAFDDGPGLVSLDDSGVVITRTLGRSTSLGARREVTRPHAVALLAGGGPLLAGEEGGVVAVYDRKGLARAGELRLPVGRLGAPPDVEAARRRVSALATTSDGRFVIAGDRTGRLTVWSWPDRKVRWSVGDAPTAFLGLTPDGRVLVTAEFSMREGDPSPDGSPDSSWVRLWDMRTGEVLARFDTGERKPRTVAVSPDSRTAVVGFFGEDTDVLDLTTRRVVHTLDADASAMTFTPDGDGLVLVDFAGHGRVFATDGWAQVGEFSTLTSGYAHLLIEPAGRLMFLASGTDVAVWDASELRRLSARLSLSGDGSNDGIFLAKAADEPVLAVASQSEVALIDLRESTWRAVACRIADRRLTRDEWERLVPGRAYAPACA